MSGIAAGTFDGVGTTVGFKNARGLVVAPNGVLLVADTGGQKIRSVLQSGIVSTVAGNGSTSITQDGYGTNALFSNPYGIAMDSSNNAYVADYSSHRVRMISPLGLVTTLAGGGVIGPPVSVSGSGDAQGTNAGFLWPTGVTVSQITGVIITYVVDYGNHKIRSSELNAENTPTSGVQY